MCTEHIMSSPECNSVELRRSAPIAILSIRLIRKAGSKGPVYIYVPLH